jgi:hypothetical protein
MKYIGCGNKFPNGLLKTVEFLSQNLARFFSFQYAEYHLLNTFRLFAQIRGFHRIFQIQLCLIVMLLSPKCNAIPAIDSALIHVPIFDRGI